MVEILLRHSGPILSEVSGSCLICDSPFVVQNTLFLIMWLYYKLLFEDLPLETVS